MFDIGKRIIDFEVAEGTSIQTIVNEDKTNNVKKVMFVASNIEESELSLKLCHGIEGTYTSVGIWPESEQENDFWYNLGQKDVDSQKLIADQIRQLEDLLIEDKSSRKIIAIGECGLDFDIKMDEKGKYFHEEDR